MTSDITSSKTLGFLPPRTCLVWWWDVGIPLMTWVLLTALLTLDQTYRILISFIWAVPVLLGTRFAQSNFFGSLLSTVSNRKKLCVSMDKPYISHILNGETPCILGLHPHGRYPMNVLPWFASRPDLFRNTTLAQSSLGKFIPTIGWVTMFCSVIDVDKVSIQKSLLEGRNVSLFPGGAREMVYCRPGDKQIPIIKRTGFLRLAYSSPCSEWRPVVIPCYMFGMHDAFFNPLAIIDKALFYATGANIPLWLPTLSSASSNGQMMVFGEPVNPSDYKTQEDFNNAYYLSLESAFNENKSRFPQYAKRTLHFVDIISKDKLATKSTKASVEVFSAAIKLLFVFVLPGIIARWTTGSWWRTSTFQPFEINRDQSLSGGGNSGTKWSQHDLTTLEVHIYSGITWVLISSLASGQAKGRYVTNVHRLVGYVAILALVITCGTASYLAFAILSYSKLMQNQEFFFAI